MSTKKCLKRKEESARMVIEEIKERPDLTVEEDTEEMKRWGSLNPIEIDLCWKSLAGRGSLGQIQSRREQKEGF